MITKQTNTMKEQGVIGFYYSEDKSKVALIHKNKPEWQKGKLNGIGGKVEPNEAIRACMIREFIEEAGLPIYEWTSFCTVNFPKYELFCYSACGDLSKVKTMESEKIEIFSVGNMPMLDTIPNLQWLVPMGASSELLSAIVNVTF